MAVIKQGILGGGSGSVASVVMSSWKGRAILKAKPLSVANPNTALQAGQRMSFKSIAMLGSILLTGYVQKVLNVVSGNITGYNKFCSDNKTAFNSVGTFVPANFKVGGGQLPTVATMPLAEESGTGNIEVTFTSEAGLPVARNSDKVVFMAYCPETNDVWVSPGTGARNVGTTVLALQTPGSDLTGELQVYVGPAFTSADGRSVSKLAGLTAFAINFGA